MRKISFLALVAILCASVAWAQDPSQPPTAQDPNTQSPSTSQSPTASSPSSSTTPSSNTGIQGCLSGSDGNYVLTQDGTGTVYKLSGGDSKLKDHVGHEVQISGQLVNNGTPDQTQTSTTASAAAASASMLQVSDVTMISEKCLTSGGSGSPSASNTTAADATAAAAASTPETTGSNATAGSTSPTDPSANAGQTTPDTTGSTAAAQPSYASPGSATGTAQAQDNSQNSPPAQASDNDAAMQSNKTANRNTDSMPKTASDLPEIGLLGLSLLAAGLASRRRNDLLG